MNTIYNVYHKAAYVQIFYGKFPTVADLLEHKTNMF